MKRKSSVIAIVFTLILTSTVSYFITRSTLTDRNIIGKISSAQEKIKNELVVIENNVKLREKPEPNSFDIKEFGIGDKVEILTKSQEKSKIFDDEDYWYNIKYKNQTGWIFGTYLTDEIGINETICSKYKNFLTTLFENDPNSIENAINTYKKYAVISKDINTNNEMFRSFRAYYSKALKRQELNESEQKKLSEAYKKVVDIGRLNKGEGVTDDKLIDKISALARNGFYINYYKDKFYVSEQPGFFLYNFTDISEEIKEFLFLRSKDLEDETFNTKATNVDWDSLGEKIVLWESYIGRNQNLIETLEARNLLSTYYIPIYLKGIEIGLDDSYNKKRLPPQRIKSYEWFVINNTDSEYWGLINEYYDILQKNGFVFNEEAESFLRKKGIK